MVRPPESKCPVTEYLVCLVVTTTTGDNHQKRREGAKHSCSQGLTIESISSIIKIINPRRNHYDCGIEIDGNNYSKSSIKCENDQDGDNIHMPGGPSS